MSEAAAAQYQEMIYGDPQGDRPGRGRPTVVNGQVNQPVLAYWTDVSAFRATAFLKEEELGTPSYDVYFLPAVLGAPWLLKDGSSVLWKARNYTGVVRRMEIYNDNDIDIVVVALVVLTTRL